MKIDFKRLLIILLAIVVQIILDNYCDLGLYIRILILPVIILTLPYKVKTIEAMCIAFLIGVVTDIFTSGVIGLNAGALAASALVRRKILYSILDERNIDRHDYPNYRVMGLSKSALYVSVPYIVYFITYTLLDNYSFSPFSLSIPTILICSGINTVLGLFIFSRVSNH